MTKSLISLTQLFHHRWAVPALAAFDKFGGGAKLITIQHAISSNRDSLRRTFLALREQGLIERNQGYGHPMRPEYCLTARGKPIASACQRLVDTVWECDVQEIAFKKWTLPVIFALSESGGRFNGTRRLLNNITPRALGRALQDLSTHKVIERILIDSNPPRTEYRLTDHGALLVIEVKALAVLLN